MKRRSPCLRLLWPLSLIYSFMAASKAWCYTCGILRARKLPGTVISVGNLTVGGTGKTPMVLAIAERLARDEKHTAILTRGYRGAVDAAEPGVPQSDEVALLHERLGGKVQLGVGPDRYSNGLALAKHGVDWFVLDDGFQHLKLSRGVDVVLVDATDPFGGGMALPAGRLREPLSALKRADMVVITRSRERSSPAVEAVIRRHTECPIFYACAHLDNVLTLPRLNVALPRADWGRAKFLAFCAIGNPSAFYEDLRSWGFQLVGQRSFADHHVYSAAEAAELERAAASSGADALLCSEKDVWNLRNVQFASLPVYCVRISFELPDQFWGALAAAAERGKANRVQ